MQYKTNSRVWYASLTQRIDLLGLYVKHCLTCSTETLGSCGGSGD